MAKAYARARRPRRPQHRRTTP